MFNIGDRVALSSDISHRCYKHREGKIVKDVNQYIYTVDFGDFTAHIGKSKLILIVSEPRTREFKGCELVAYWG